MGPIMTIEEVCRAARAEGLSYGQYVAQHNPALAVKPRDTKTQDTKPQDDGFTRCLYCGHVFTPTRRGHKFCRDSCRSGYRQKKKAIGKKG